MRWSLLVFALFVVGCRKDPPPPIEICILDGVGGGNCVTKQGDRVYRLPSEMLGYWSTTEDDMAAYSSWCYRTQDQSVRVPMDAVKRKAFGLK